MDLTGKIKVLFDEQKFDSGFYKREFVIATEEQYPQDVKFEVFKEKTEMLNGKNVGDVIKVSFDIRGREWQGKYFNNLVAWKIESVGANASASAPAEGAPAGSPAPAPFPTIDPVDVNSADDDDLPF